MLTITTLYLLDVQGSASPRSLNIILGVTLLVSAAGMLFLRRLRRPTVRHHPSAVAARLLVPGTVLAGFVLGVLVTLTSVGAGALGMIVLVLLYTDTPIDRLVGSDIAHAVPLTLIAGCGRREGDVPANGCCQGTGRKVIGSGLDPSAGGRTARCAAARKDLDNGLRAALYLTGNAVDLDGTLTPEWST